MIGFKKIILTARTLRQSRHENLSK